MSQATRRTLIMHPVGAATSEIDRWLWALTDARQRTLTSLADLTPAVLDWTPPVGGNAIGTLLYHIAAIEIDWLLAEVLEVTAFPPEVELLFPLDVRSADGRLTVCAGVTLADHLARLDTVRTRLLTVFRTMTLAEFRRVRQLPAYDVTPEWVLHHLMQHEAEHRGEIGLVRLLAARDLNSAE